MNILPGLGGFLILLLIVRRGDKGVFRKKIRSRISPGAFGVSVVFFISPPVAGIAIKSGIYLGSKLLLPNSFAGSMGIRAHANSSCDQDTRRT